MHSPYAGPLASYNSLQDEHLAEFYSHPRRLRHLRRMGLITKEGDIVDEATLRLNNALKTQKRSTKDALANSILNKAVEAERQARIEMKHKLELLAKCEMAEKVKRHSRHPVGVDEGFNPYPYQDSPATHTTQTIVTQRALKLGIDESLLSSHLHMTAQLRKIISLRAPPSPYISKSLSMPVVLQQPHPPAKPKPPTSRPSRRRPKTSPVEGLNTSQRYPMRSQVSVTLCYVGQSVHLEGSVEHDTVDVMILQQHCGGNTVCVFKGKVRPRGWFTFTSRRHKDCPFGISIYLNSMFDCRLSTCCEYRHMPGKILGSKTSHFGLVKVEGGTACYKCQGVADLVNPTSLSKKKTSEVRRTPTQVTDNKESDTDINVDDIVKKYKSNDQDNSDQGTSDKSSTASLHNTRSEASAKNKVASSPLKDSEDQQESITTSDNKTVSPSCSQDVPSTQEVDQPSKRRSVVFSPDTKDLDTDETKNRSITTSQTIRDAKEILKKSSSGYSFSSVLTSESDKSDIDVLSSSSSSSEVDMLESRVSQLESGLITDHHNDEDHTETKGDQETSESKDDQETVSSNNDKETINTESKQDQDTAESRQDQHSSKVLMSSNDGSTSKSSDDHSGGSRTSTSRSDHQIDQVNSQSDHQSTLEETDSQNYSSKQSNDDDQTELLDTPKLDDNRPEDDQKVDDHDQSADQAVPVNSQPDIPQNQSTAQPLSNNQAGNDLPDQDTKEDNQDISQPNDQHDHSNCDQGSQQSEPAVHDHNVP